MSRLSQIDHPFTGLPRDIGDVFFAKGIKFEVVKAEIRENPCANCFWVPGMKECERYMGKDPQWGINYCHYKHRSPAISVCVKRVEGGKQ